jgi:cytidylate kinase
VVAIDGPAGVGKSTVARQVAAALGLPYLDTGAMYRALALRALEAGVDLDDEAAVGALAESTAIDVRAGADHRLEILLDREPVDARIRTPAVSEATSRIAVHPRVRARLVGLQRTAARQGGAVVEGRDIGTRIFPDTRHKFFLTASTAERASRRHAELTAAGRGASLVDVTRDLERRDARDSGRVESPLAHDGSYLVIDTSGVKPDQVVETIVAAVRRAGGG